MAIAAAVPLLRPVDIPADETWVAPAILDPAAASARLRALVAPRVTHRDDASAILDALAPALVFLPFWRVKLAVPAIHLAPSARGSIAIGNIEFPMPARSYGGRAGVLMVCARESVPYAPRLPAFFGGTDGDALEVQRSALLPLTNDRARALVDAGEVLAADVDRERGERLAADALVELLQPAETRRVRSVFRPRVESTLFVRYPTFRVTFGDDDEYFVLLSARDGNVISARYPRVPTISERVKRFFKA